MARKRRKWTDEDRQFLKDNYQNITNRELGEHFGITGAGIGYQLNKLGLNRERIWTEEKDDFLRNNYLKMINRELARELGKTICAIEKRLGTLRLRRLQKWTPEREQFLRDNFETMSNAFLSKKLGVTELAVAKKLSRMGLTRKGKGKWSIGIYLQDVRNHPLLSYKQERKLFAEFEKAKEEKDEKEILRLKEEIVEANLRLVLKVASRCTGYTNASVSFLDLVQAGNIGLMNNRTKGGIQMAKTLMFCFSLTLIAVIAEAADPTLVLYLTLDEGQGDIVRDLSQNGNSGELEDGPKWVEGKFGKALEFSEGSRVHIPASDSLHCDMLKDGFTLTAWVKPTLTGDEWQQIWRSIDENDSSPHTLFVNTDGFFSWRGRAGGQWAERCVTPGGMVKADEWAHVAVVGDKEDFRIYINGEEAGTAPFVELDGGLAEFYLGFDGRQWNERFSGIIDEFCIFTRALTVDEIKAGAEGTMMQLLSVWPIGKLAATWGEIKSN